MNYIILDIIDNLSISQQIKSEIRNLLIWQELHSSPPFSLYFLQHDSFSCIFNTAKTQDPKKDLLSSQLTFRQQECVIRPILKACVNSCDAALSIIYISNNPKRWIEDLSTKCRAYFLTPTEGHIIYSVHQAIRSIFPIIVPLELSGLLIISNDSKTENGVSFEILIKLQPVILPLRKLNNVTVELQMEWLIRRESLGIELLYGTCWVITSVSNDFLSICSGLAEKNLFFICSSLVDLDQVCSRDLPMFYALFPATDMPNHMLIRKVPSKEYFRIVSFSPVRGCDFSDIEKFIFRNFEIQDFDPGLLNSCLFELVSEMGKTEKIEVIKGLKCVKNNESVGKKKRRRKPKNFIET